MMFVFRKAVTQRLDKHVTAEFRIGMNCDITPIVFFTIGPTI